MKNRRGASLRAGRVLRFRAGRDQYSIQPSPVAEELSE